MAVLGGIWKKFIDLLPSSPRYIGTIVTVDGDGMFTVQLLGGGLIQARGAESYKISDRVFLVDKKIESKAPNLPGITIEV